MFVTITASLGIPILVAGTARRVSCKRSKKKKARERMKRIQLITQHHRLHETERKYASVAGGSKPRPSLGGHQKLEGKKKPSSQIKIKPKKRNTTKRSLMDAAKKRTAHKKALQKSASLRERVRASRQRNRDLWDCAVAVSM